MTRRTYKELLREVSALNQMQNCPWLLRYNNSVMQYTVGGTLTASYSRPDATEEFELLDVGEKIFVWLVEITSGKW